MTWKINNSFFPQHRDNSSKDCDPAIVLSAEQIQFAPSLSGATIPQNHLTFNHLLFVDLMGVYIYQKNPRPFQGNEDMTW